MEQSRPPIFLYTDGASSGNPGPGGYGVVLKCAGISKEMSEGFSLTTNNRMELLAVIKGLEAIRWDNAEVHVYSDSSYVVNAVNEGWLENWKRRGFSRVPRGPPLLHNVGDFALDFNCICTKRVIVDNSNKSDHKKKNTEGNDRKIVTHASAAGVVHSHVPFNTSLLLWILSRLS